MNVAMPLNFQGLGYVEAIRKATANFNEEVQASHELVFREQGNYIFLHKPSGQKLMRMIT